MKHIPIEDLNLDVRLYDKIKKYGVNYVHEFNSTIKGAQTFFSISDEEKSAIVNAVDRLGLSRKSTEKS